MSDKQTILVFQQNGAGEAKIRGIIEHGGGRFTLQRVVIDEPLPPLIEDARSYLPAEIRADLVLDFLAHPDLSHDLALICSQRNIPVVASGRKLPGTHVLTPPTWCGLPRQVCLGRYGEKFGAPELEIKAVDGRIGEVRVVRGAPCGATWEAAERIRDLRLEAAVVQIGLEVQYFCSADPAGWDPIHGKSPVHFAGNIHAAALKRAATRRQNE